MADDGLLGFSVRRDLFPGEADFFQKNPSVSGMASETGDIILNPQAPPNVDMGSVARNEAFRLLLRSKETVPNFSVPDEQRQFFKGTIYENDEEALRSTIAARVFAGDPSVRPTTEQMMFVRKFLRANGQDSQ